MAEYTHVGPGLPPLHGARANALILGSFPSPKSREQGFFYGHKQNRFWPMIAAVTGEPVPDWADIEAKKAIILKHGLAVGLQEGVGGRWLVQQQPEIMHTFQFGHAGGCKLLLVHQLDSSGDAVGMGDGGAIGEVHHAAGRPHIHC